ncbi:MLO protein 1-like protein [Cinnamomum micranthum f. kanehirae]|uniref:MLO-like protein n=1 Tax=Cinnamomum micranthum f. kanehirae TaxID=337451 RepID=A0A3S3P769_9MAGN|nr:MLO protein 1-like protein [Cinnamomum micranthum f. kanehirae]
MAVAAAGERTLKETPTWAVAAVCATIIIISVVMEHGIHSLGKWFQKKNRKAMLEALEKIKAELMLLGFISLLLTVGQKYIAKICIPAKAGDTMLPCMKNYGNYNPDSGNKNRRKLLWYSDEDLVWRRALAAPAGGGDYCSSRGNKVSLISQSGVHQLHIFIFVLAVFHVLYSVITMALGRAKMKRWKSWESETASLEYQFTNDPARFRFTHQTSFVRRHAGVTRTPGLRWIVAFFRQFFGSVSRVDYLTMRHGFINILLLVGMKLEVIIMDMAEQIQDRTAVVKGVPVVEPSNKFFWFNRPHWILFLIHFTLFQYEYGLTSCFHENLPAIVTRVVMGVALQFLCSYITFPLYALVTQMGSHMKKAIFEEQTAKALKKWQKVAKERSKQRKEGGEIASGNMSGEVTPSQGSSPIHLLHKYKSHSADIESVPNSPRSYQSDELSEMEYPAMAAPAQHVQEPRRQQPLPRDRDEENTDFSFVQSLGPGH